MVARRSNLRGEEVLREKQVLVAVTVEVRHARVERRGELRLRGQGHRLEPPPSVEEDLVVERHSLEALSACEHGTEDVTDGRVRVCGERPGAEADRRQRGHEPAERREGSDRVQPIVVLGDRKSTRLNSSHGYISYAVFCLKKKKKKKTK